MGTARPRQDTQQTKKPVRRRRVVPVRVVAVQADGTQLNATLQATPTAVEDKAERTVVVASDKGKVCAGYRGSAVGGFQSEATAQCEGLAYVLGGSAECFGHYGIAITRTGGPDGTASAVDYLAVTYRGGHAKMGGSGIAIAINDAGKWNATAQAGIGGVIILGYRTKDEDIPVRYVVKEVDGVIIKPQKPYKLDKDHRDHPLVEA